MNVYNRCLVTSLLCVFWVTAHGATMQKQPLVNDRPITAENPAPRPHPEPRMTKPEDLPPRQHPMPQITPDMKQRPIKSQPSNFSGK